MNIGILREGNPLDRRVAVTPPVVRKLVERGSTVLVETGAGEGAMFRDDEYIRAGALIAYSAAEVIHRSELVVKISVPTLAELELGAPGAALLAFYHMAVASPAVFETLLQREITAIGCEIVRAARRPSATTHPGERDRRPDDRFARRAPAALEFRRARHSAGRHARRSSRPRGGHRSGNCGSCATRGAMAAGARVTVLDIDNLKLRRLIQHVPHVATVLADEESIGAAVASADVVIGAVLVAGAKTPHVVTSAWSRPCAPARSSSTWPSTRADASKPAVPLPSGAVLQVHGVVHYCVPNLTADLGRSTSIALAQALMP